MLGHWASSQTVLSFKHESEPLTSLNHIGVNMRKEKSGNWGIGFSVWLFLLVDSVVSSFKFISTPNQNTFFGC